MRVFIHKLSEKLFGFKTQLFHPELKRAYSIVSHLTAKERFTLFQIAKGRKRIVEIGSYMGASATCFGAATKNDPDAKIYCIDTWNNDAMTEGKKETFKVFSDNTKEFSHAIIPVKGFSTEVVDIIKKETEKVDLLFIDGDHSYEGVKADWEAYKKFLQIGSVVAFHDVGWAEGVKKVIKEDALPFIQSHKSLPNLWWGTVSKTP